MKLSLAVVPGVITGLIKHCPLSLKSTKIIGTYYRQSGYLWSSSGNSDTVSILQMDLLFRNVVHDRASMASFRKKTFHTSKYFGQSWISLEIADLTIRNDCEISF